MPWWGRAGRPGSNRNELDSLGSPPSSTAARRRARTRRIVDLLPLALVAALLAIRVWDPVPVAGLREQVFDLYQRAQPRPPAADPRVLIVDIDDRSLREIGQWPWPRTLLADLVQRIAADGAVAVAFDILFSEPDRLSPTSIAENIAIIDPTVAERLRASTSLLLILLMPRLGALPTLILGTAMVITLAGGSWYLFRVRSLLLDVSFPALAGIVVYSVLVYVKYLREEGTRKTIRRAFDRYLSAELIDRLVADPGQLALGGETREATVLFSDIRNFTTLSEGLKAAALTELVNRVLTTMTAAIQSHGGTIDKYIGDAVMAFWNAPLRDPEHERRACRAAIDLVASVRTLNEALEAESHERSTPWPELRVGVGLNSGLCCIGNVGSVQRFNYSALGNAVNLASRLEEQTKVYGCPIVVGHETAVAAGDLAFLELDVVRVRGKLQPTRIHALLGDGDLARQPSFRALREAHDALLDAYRDGRIEEALRNLDTCRARRGDLPLRTTYDLYERRLRAGRFEPLGGEAHGHAELREPGTA